MFDESLTTAESFLKPAFRRVSLEYVPQNVTRAAPRSTERLIRLWGADLYEDLARFNQFDLELFRRAENEIRRRFALLPNPQFRLHDFRSRCARLRGDVPTPIPIDSEPVTNVRTLPGNGRSS